MRPSLRSGTRRNLLEAARRDLFQGFLRERTEAQELIRTLCEVQKEKRIRAPRGHVIRVGGAAAEPSRFLVRWYRVAREARKHGAHCRHLPAVLVRIVGVVVAPPVPTTDRVAPGETGPAGQRIRLWIEDNEIVGVGSLVVAGLLNVGVRNLATRPADKGRTWKLLAAVEDHMHPAGAAGRAGGGHVRPTRGPHAVGGGRADEFSLIELDESATEIAHVFRVQRPVDPLQQLARRVEVAVVDEGISFSRTGVAEGARRHRVLGRDVLTKG